MSQVSQKQIDNFVDQGYIILPSLFDSSEIEILLSRANHLKNEAEGLARLLPNDEVHKVMHRGSQFVIQNIDELVKIHRIVWAGAAEVDLLDISKQSKLLSPISQLLETPSADYIINSFHLKLPNDGVQFSLHQDIHHRRSFDEYWENINGDRSYVVCITAIEEMTTDNGPIMIIPGSHKKGEIPQEKLKDIFDLNSAIPLLLEPGDTSCMHQYLLHWSLPNESSDSRFTLVNGFAYPGANHGVYPGEGSGEQVYLAVESDL